MRSIFCDDLDWVYTINFCKEPRCLACSREDVRESCCWICPLADCSYTRLKICDPEVIPIIIVAQFNIPVLLNKINRIYYNIAAYGCTAGRTNDAIHTNIVISSGRDA